MKCTQVTAVSSHENTVSLCIRAAQRCASHGVRPEGGRHPELTVTRNAERGSVRRDVRAATRVARRGSWGSWGRCVGACPRRSVDGTLGVEACPGAVPEAVPEQYQSSTRAVPEQYQSSTRAVLEQLEVAVRVAVHDEVGLQQCVRLRAWQQLGNSLRAAPLLRTGSQRATQAALGFA
jgi:hypothetical protein